MEQQQLSWPAAFACAAFAASMAAMVWGFFWWAVRVMTHEGETERRIKKARESLDAKIRGGCRQTLPGAGE